MKKALVLIDIQNDYFEGGKFELVNPMDAVNNAERILKLFRDSNLPVIHVQHVINREGAPMFVPGTHGVEIHSKLTPRENEYVVIKHAPSSFYRTNLSDILKDNDIKDIVVCGMMSHMCVETTVRAAKDYELNVTLIEDACATKDLMYYDTVIPAETVHKTAMASMSGMFAALVKTSEFSL